MSLARGTRFGRFEVRSLLGVGGIGEVYVAQDTKLERQVALKVLRGEMARDEQHALRFIQEAKAAANLSHPNISHVYEIGEAQGANFIAMEYVEGVTLRQRLDAGPVELEEAIEIATQTAAALAEAHAAGIVHRDIKPENIMLRRPDQTVKVLDFGIAKITDRYLVRHAEASEVTTVVRTEPNMIMGTVNYMSPEQARGLPVDARTDIFSLGVVLYEMLAGRKPFDGPSRSDAIAELLRKDPARLEGIPEGLEWTLAKAMAKDANERYQDAREMLADLKRVKHRFLTETNSAGSDAASGRSPEVYDQTSVTKPQPRETFSSKEHVLTDARRKRIRAAALAGGFCLIALAVFGFGALKPFSPAALTSLFPNQRAGVSQPKIMALTNNGKANLAAVSADGKYVAYVMSDTGGQSIRVKHLATLSETEIVSPMSAEVSGVSFSPDGSYVYYVKFEKLTGALYQVPMLGGTSKKMLDDVAFGQVGLSPDGQRVAFVRRYTERGEYALVSANLESGAEEILHTRKAPDDLSYPAWSPDGRVIVFAQTHFDPKQFHWDLAEVRLDDRTVRTIAEKRWWWIGGIAWLSHGEGLIIVAREISSPVIPIWRVSYPAGEAMSLTNDTNLYGSLSLAAGAQRIVVARTEVRANISIQAAGPNAAPVQITSGRENGSLGLSWTADGRIVYATRGVTTGETWMMNADGSGKRLIANVGAHQLAISANGEMVVFDSVRSGAFNIWRMGIDGHNLQRITNGAAEFDPAFSAGDQSVVYVTGTVDDSRIWQVPINGGQSRQLTDRHSHTPAVSPDGKLLAFYYTDESAAAKFKLGIMALASGELQRSLEVPADVNPQQLAWTPDGRSLSFVRSIGGVANVWSLPANGGKPRPVTNFSADEIIHFAWSRDGRLALTRGSLATDIFLVTDFN